MTTDPVRLLAQDDDSFSASLLKAARDGDAATARTRKAAVLGAAGGAAFGGATLAAAKLSSKSVWAMMGGKWLAFGLLFTGGLGVTVAALWSSDAPAPTPPAAIEPAAAQLAPPASPSPSDQPANQAAPAPPSEQPANQAAPAPAPADETTPDGAPAAQKPLASAAARSSSSTDSPSPDSPASSNAAPPTVAQPASTPASSNAAAPAPPADAASELAAEVAALRSAREALGRGQPQKCLEAVNAYFAAFPKGHLSAEARLLRIEAMAAAGQRAQAAALARSMLAQSPRSPYASRLRALAGEPSTP